MWKCGIGIFTRTSRIPLCLSNTSQDSRTALRSLSSLSLNTILDYIWSTPRTHKTSFPTHITRSASPAHEILGLYCIKKTSDTEMLSVSLRIRLWARREPSRSMFLDEPLRLDQDRSTDSRRIFSREDSEWCSWYFLENTMMARWPAPLICSHAWCVRSISFLLAKSPVDPSKTIMRSLQRYWPVFIVEAQTTCQSQLLSRRSCSLTLRPDL